MSLLTSSHSIFKVLLALFITFVSANTPGNLTCLASTGPNSGCTAESGHSYDYVVQRVKQTFDQGYTYGGDGQKIVYAAVNIGSVVVEVAYECTDFSVPPAIAGLDAQAQIQKIANCGTQCGTIYTTDKCAFLMFIFTNYDGAPADRAYVDAIPSGKCCTSVPSSQKLLSDLESLESQVDSFSELAADWLEELQAENSTSGSSRKVKRASSGVQMRFDAMVNGYPMVSMRAANVLDEFDDAAANNNQVAVDNLQRVQQLNQLVQDLRQTVAGLSAASLAAATAFVVGAGRLTVRNLRELTVVTVAAVVGQVSKNGGSSTATPTMTSKPGSTPTTTTTSSSSSTVCDVCSIFNSGAARPTVIARSLTTISVTKDAGTKSEHELSTPQSLPTDDDAVEVFNTTSIEERSLEKRSRRVYNLAVVGGRYGAAFGGSQPTINVCTNQADLFSFAAPGYPSTSGTGPANPPDDGQDDPNAPPTNSAPNLPGIGALVGGPYASFDYEYDRGGPDSGLPPYSIICGVKINGFPNSNGCTGDSRYLQATGRTNAQSLYFDTEHIFELHIVKDFFVWLLRNNYETCQRLHAIFGAQDSAANMMMSQMSDGSDARLHELYVLERGLNQYKGAFMNGRPLDENESQNHVLPRPNSWNDCQQHLQKVQAMFLFINSPGPRAAFVAVRNRIHNYLGDNTQFPEIDEHPSAGTYQQLWDQFMTQWMQKRQSDTTNWYNELRQTCLPLAPDCLRNDAFAFNYLYSVLDYQFPADWTP